MCLVFEVQYHVGNILAVFKTSLEKIYSLHKSYGNVWNKILVIDPFYVTKYESKNDMPN